MVFGVWLALSFYIINVIESQDVIIGGELNDAILLDYKAENFFESHVFCFFWLSHPGLEKEIGALQQEEKKLVAEIKRTAKTGNEAATKILARQLIRLRQQIANLQGSRAQMRGIATHTQAMHAQSSVAVGLKGANKAMETMNKQMAPEKQMKVIREFQKQSAQMDMTVLDEIGVDVSSQLSAAPKGKIAGKNREGASSSGTDELEKRLAALRNP
ncbi:CHARGED MULTIVESICULAR BODY PROTEIN [Salix purpurea]|uniref:CHARGED MULTIVESICULAR BODY PROTEIN n=1 Tax=Salix purpurea TaxID=77065 RepID=A0A9Q0PBA3_SALPP|nr:CHARGED MULTIVESICULAR BODY PROTEIN [Salix purpurea]